MPSRPHETLMGKHKGILLLAPIDQFSFDFCFFVTFPGTVITFPSPAHWDRSENMKMSAETSLHPSFILFFSHAAFSLCLFSQMWLRYQRIFTFLSLLFNLSFGTISFCLDFPASFHLKRKQENKKAFHE